LATRPRHVANEAASFRHQSPHPSADQHRADEPGGARATNLMIQPDMIPVMVPKAVPARRG
jgi:hypothetical protein